MAIWSEGQFRSTKVGFHGLMVEKTILYLWRSSKVIEKNKNGSNFPLWHVDNLYVEIKRSHNVKNSRKKVKKFNLAWESAIHSFYKEILKALNAYNRFFLESSLTFYRLFLLKGSNNVTEMFRDFVIQRWDKKREN